MAHRAKAVERLWNIGGASHSFGIAKKNKIRHSAQFQKCGTHPNIGLLKNGWLWILLLALPALWPFYSEGLPRSFDGGLHLLRLSLLDEQIRQGILLPRWTPSLILGYGYPLYNFYAPGAYYLAGALHLLGLDLYYAFIGAFVIQIIAAGWGMYLLARDLFHRGDHNRPLTPQTEWSAIVAATAYLYGPYLLTNVYIRGAIAEAGAQALLPWIFWGMRRLVRDPNPARYFLLVIFTLGMLAITHNITLLFLPPVLLLFTLIQWLAGPDKWQRLIWVTGAFFLAMGISAFFWLPLLLERHDLADTAYLISRSAWLPGSAWTWQNFLDMGLHYTHTFARPIKLGIAQILLAGLGFLLAFPYHKRRIALGEWLFWLVVTVGVAAMMGRWALPLWLSNDILPIAQFTWRLLSILSVPLALFVGGIILAWPGRWLPIFVGAVTIGGIIFTQRPQLAWMDVYAADSATVSQPVFAQIEIDKGVITGGHRNSSIQEFRPRWADTDLVLAADVDTPPAPATVTVSEANEFDLMLTADAATTTFLRFATFYFPGWEVRIDGAIQPTYPSTNLGLLTVDLPAGSHQVTVRWAGTIAQQVGGYLALLTLAILLYFCYRQRELRFYALLPALLLIIGTLALHRTLPRQTVVQPATPIGDERLELRGLRLAEDEPGYLYLYPYWHVHERLPATIAMHWQLTNHQGNRVSEAVTHPYFNAARADSWAPGLLMDDVQRLPLPPMLDVGDYQLALQLLDGDEAITEMQPVTTYHLATVPPPTMQPQQTLDLRYGDRIRLVGHTLRADGANVAPQGIRPPVVRAGQYLRYTLFWQADGLIAQNYHAFVHLTDIHGMPLVQEDQLPGPLFHAPQLWNNVRPYNDSYLLRIPNDASSGLYWPGVGVYDFATLNRLPIPESDADRHLLPPIKILGETISEPTVTSEAYFGDMAMLLGYTVATERTVAEPLQGGDPFTITLFLRSENATNLGYTRFVQVYDPTLGMAAQFDSPPQSGANPTWAWVPGETIEDTIPLTVQADVAAGTYGIFTGFYDPANGVRLPVQLADGKLEPAGWVQVGTVVIEE